MQVQENAVKFMKGKTAQQVQQNLGKVAPIAAFAPVTTTTVTTAYTAVKNIVSSSDDKKKLSPGQEHTSAPLSSSANTQNSKPEHSSRTTFLNKEKLMAAEKHAMKTPATALGELNHPIKSPAYHGETVYKGSIDCAKQIFKRKGISGLYRGWWTEFWRDTPSYGLWFVAYEGVKYHMTPPDQKPSTGTLLAAGSAAGIATWIVTYPFDVMKSVVQAAPDSTPEAKLKMSYIARTHYEQYGLRWFWTGLGTTLVRAVPVSAVTFLVYENLMSYMTQTDVHDHEECDHENVHTMPK
jgi:hypothetical protein